MELINLSGCSPYFGGGTPINYGNLSADKQIYVKLFSTVLLFALIFSEFIRCIVFHHSQSLINLVLFSLPLLAAFFFLDSLTAPMTISRPPPISRNASQPILERREKDR